MRLQTVYREIDDKDRADANEADARVRVRNNVLEMTIDSKGGLKRSREVPGAIDVSSENFSCKYLLCCSAPAADMTVLKAKFGQFVVKIHGLNRLASQVTKYCKENRVPIICDAEWIKVQYTRGRETKIEPSHAELAELSIKQKDPIFSDEREYRMVVITSLVENCADDIVVDLGAPLDYVSVLSV